MYKHYIRIDNNGTIIKAFSNAFEAPTASDILIGESDSRHYNIQLRDQYGFMYKWQDGKFTNLDRTQTLLTAYKSKKIQTVRGICERDIEKGIITHNGKQFTTSKIAQQNWTGILVRLGANAIQFPFTVFANDGESVQIADAEELVELTGKIFDFVYRNRLECNTKEFAINTATTMEQVQAV